KEILVRDGVAVGTQRVDEGGTDAGVGVDQGAVDVDKQDLSHALHCAIWGVTTVPSQCGHCAIAAPSLVASQCSCCGGTAGCGRDTVEGIPGRSAPAFQATKERDPA